MKTYTVTLSHNTCTLTCDQTGRSESWPTSGRDDPRILKAIWRCKSLGINITLA